MTDPTQIDSSDLKATETGSRANGQLDPYARARLHSIVCEKPAVNFFEGALLGNGALGAVVTTRPDAIVIHFGHNNVWDIRVAEPTMEDIGTFSEIYERIANVPPEIKSLDQETWFREYRQKIERNYRQKPYPRPFPCGSLLLGFDRRHVELLGHELDIATGVCRVKFLMGQELRTLQMFVEPDCDRLWMQMVDSAGELAHSPFERVRLIPDPETPEDMPLFVGQVSDARSMLSFRQTLPALEPENYDLIAGHAADRAFRLTVCLTDRFSCYRKEEERSFKTEFINSFLSPSAEMRQDGLQLLEQWLEPAPGFVACVQLTEGEVEAVPTEPVCAISPNPAAYRAAAATAVDRWRSYWRQSGVALDDRFIEQTWYRNQYFLHCAVKSGTTCPGLFANWSYGNIGTAWHGDYHMNYNTQQAFWGVFSGNHIEKHLPYVDLIWRLLPLARRWAREYYGLRGACFPHVAFPVNMSIQPFRVPWSWLVCETPWVVQSLWWHYLYTLDLGFLRDRAFEPIREVVQFLVDYLHRPEAHGEHWKDDCYHVIPTISPELYGMTPRFERNFDCLVDITLIKFVFRAYAAACKDLDLCSQEDELLEAVHSTLSRLPAYPTAETAHGPVFVSLPGESPEVVYNTPNSTATVFPGEEHGPHSPSIWYQLACNSFKHQRNEGGNDLVFLNLQGARLGMLDLERFKRQLRYCQIPNGTFADMVLQTHGRYKDEMPFDFMARMGVWFENFSLPAVINECLLQSYTGTLRLFPNWPSEQAAHFCDLRAVGAFLVSARFAAGEVQWVRIKSEAGADLRIELPWADGATVTSGTDVWSVAGGVLERRTCSGEIITLEPSA